MNPMDLMKFKERLSIFAQQHPRFPAFIREVNENAVMTGTVAEVKITTPDGREYISNIRLTEEDMETIRLMRGLRG